MNNYESYPCKICNETGIFHHFRSPGYNEQKVNSCQCLSFYDMCKGKQCTLVKGSGKCEVCDGKGYLTWLEKIFSRCYDE